MTSAPFSETAAQGPESDDALMARYGIARVPANRFEVDGYWYTKFADALAQARRSRRDGA